LNQLGKKLICLSYPSLDASINFNHGRSLDLEGCWWSSRSWIIL